MMTPRDELLYKIDVLMYHINQTEDAIDNLEIKLRMLNKELLALKELDDEQRSPI